MGDVIQLLPDHVANQIAAGEVVQRPASVVKELLENAIDAGATRISLVVKEAGKAHIQVVDNGKGMSEEMLSKHFEAFFTTKRGKGGSGLGTHIMYNLVTQTLGGSISVESKTGDGLSYHIEFPHHRNKPRLPQY